MQTWEVSLLESIVNVTIGYFVAVLSQIIIFPWFGIVISKSKNFKIGLWFTVVSIIRSYLIRRAFNG